MDQKHGLVSECEVIPDSPGLSVDRRNLSPEFLQTPRCKTIWRDMQKSSKEKTGS